MYLEISSVAAALGKNPYESREKTLLISWARHCPKATKEYLIKNECIIPLKENEQTFTQLQKETYSELQPNEFDVKDFDTIEKNIVEEYKKKREGKQTVEEVKQLKEYTKDLLKKNNGNIQENNIIEKEQYIKGNDKMYYLNITDNACIGGKNDAAIGDILLEIKTRTRRQNVRRNEYDLYQLICYLLATGTHQGKIVQMYNKQKFDSDLANEEEYGLINVHKEPWSGLVTEINDGLKEYFMELEELIKTSNFMYLTNVIPKRIRPIAKYIIESVNIEDKDEENNELMDFTLCEENIKFKNLFRHICK